MGRRKAGTGDEPVGSDDELPSEDVAVRCARGREAMISVNTQRIINYQTHSIPALSLLPSSKKGSAHCDIPRYGF
jgi:hypothetical protein